MDASTAQPQSPRRLVRIPTEGTFAGVCAGLADYLDIDVTLVRALWLALSIVPGAVIGGLIAYVLAAFIMPVGTASNVATGRRLRRSTTNARVAGVCGGLADYLNVDPTLVCVGWVVLSVLPGAVIGGVIAYLVAWLVVPKASVAFIQQPQAA